MIVRGIGRDHDVRKGREVVWGEVKEACLTWGLHDFARGERAKGGSAVKSVTGG